MRDLALGISIGVSPRESIQAWVELVEKIDAAGCKKIWVADSQLAMKDAFAAMTLAATRTRSILIGPGVTNPLTRHVTVLANMIAALDELSNHRAVIGLGSGDSSIFPLGWKPAPRAQIEECAGHLRALLSGQEVDFGAGPVSMRTSNPCPPIFIAASQPKMLELAGRIGDGVIIMGPSNPDVVKMQLQHVARGAMLSDRTVVDLEIDLWVTLSATDDEAQALNDVRSWASAQARWLHRWEELPPSLEPFRDEIKAAAESYDFGDHLSLHAEHASQISDELTRQLAIVGTPAECARRVVELANGPVSQVSVPLLSGGRLNRLTCLTEEIWPGVRSELGLAPA
jgi:5,10-methylenetetrahydromethanopterin reductase